MTDEQEMSEGSEADLSVFASALSNASVWTSAPVDLGDRMLGAIAAERAAGGAGLGSTGAPDRVTAAPATTSVVTMSSAPSRRRSLLTRAVLPAAAAAVLAFTAGVLVERHDAPAPVAADDPADATATVRMVGTDLAPDAVASGNIFDKGAGYSIRLQMTGLDPAPQGQYYEGWLRSEAGALVSVGTFHMRGGDGTVVLWSGVAVADYGTLLVTNQIEGDQVSSSRVVLSGSIT